MKISAKNRKTILNGFFGGIENTGRGIGEGGVRELKNFWIGGKRAIRREGFRRVKAGRMEGLIVDGERGFLFGDGKVWEVRGDGGMQEVGDFRVQGPVWAERLEDRILFAGRDRWGRIVEREGGMRVEEWWGMKDFDRGMRVEEIGGEMERGRYWVGVSYVGKDGEEGGVRVERVEIGGGMRVRFEGVVAPGAEWMRIYVSPVNEGERGMGLVAEVPAGIGEFVLSRPPEIGRGTPKLRKRAILQPGPFTFYNGRVFFAKGRTLWASEAFDYGLFDPDYGEVATFPAEIKVVGRFDGGVFVVADRVYLLQGNSPEDFALKRLNPLPKTPFSAPVYLEDFPIFLASGGFYSIQDGELRNLTQSRFDPGMWEVAVGGKFRLDNQEMVFFAPTGFGGFEGFRFEDSVGCKVIERGF